MRLSRRQGGPTLGFQTTGVRMRFYSSAKALSNQTAMRTKNISKSHAPIASGMERSNPPRLFVDAGRRHLFRA